MRRIAAAFCALLIAGSVNAFTPHAGLWNNAAEGGDGFNIIVQNGVLVVTIFSYKTNGDSEWYISSGPLTNGGRSYTGTLDKYRNGRCISCAWKQNAPAGNDGAIFITFSTETTGTVTVGGRTTTIQVFDFGFGAPPDGLLGEWLFTEEIGSSVFAERFTFTTKLGATTSGNGAVYDAAARAVCELQLTGLFAGKVYCVDFAASNDTVNNQYLFRYGVDETYDGEWISPTTLRSYPMKGFRVTDPKGNARVQQTSERAKNEPMDRSDLVLNVDARAALAEIAARLRTMMQ